MPATKESTQEVQEYVNTMIQTISVSEAVAILKSRGVASISDQKLRYGIGQGKFSFGVEIVLKDRQYIIFKRKFYEWMDEYLYREDEHESNQI